MLASPAILPPLRGQHLLALIGHTPLVRLDQSTADLPGIEIWLKLEFVNPGGSVKDRPARNIILDGERTGRLNPDKIILDATSGNTGIAYAMIGAARGYKVKLCLPANASEERKRILNVLGAELVLTDPGEGSDGAFRKVRELYAADPERYFYADQYNNDANWKAHFHTTAPEIMEQTHGRLTHFVALLGTTGTFTGTSRRLKRDLPHVECWSAQPATPFHGVEGTKHLPSAIVPGIYDETVADGNLWIETEDAYAMARKMAREEGLLLGISAAGNIVAARKLGQRLVQEGKRGVIVTIACDGASKYLSDGFWNEND
ncbi:PLP-dependent cysteine synthase family protein [Paludibaculum fermentans]|uniref:Pyridoxal-phosphate dependent enzyme n=1 Tax=Paludibaculum fermentans TaxID=1473598 RepID=A0A7S7NM29_PALFE|nr:pyridoxal-phosphate dependent enzyme [Paludibaculum fermentans]QOY86117.1 pyridoxal-phosphate dependent enzyme [Paludibaculum fermentans]